MKNKISIIVPIYNSEKYLSECIESILKQTYTNIEVILVDDGSTDQSSSICKKYENIDSRVKYFFQNNFGVSAARNYGINLSEGEYIGFIDSDDFIDSRMYETMINAITEYDVDLAMCRYVNYSSEDNYNIQNEPLPYYYCGKEEIEKKIIPLMIGSSSKKIQCPPIMGSSCRCLYKASIIKNSDIKFKKIKIAEDTVFNLEYLCSIDSAYIIKDAFYYYRVNMNSATRKYITDLYSNLCIQRNLTIEILKKNNLTYLDEYIDNAWLYFVTWCIKNEILDLTKNKKDKIKQMKYYRNDKVYNKLLNHKHLKNVYWKERIFFYLLKYRCFKFLIILMR